MENSEKNTSNGQKHDAALLFLRIFTGAMLLTGVITKSQNFISLSEEYPSFWGIDGGTIVSIVGIIEVVCAAAVIIGLWLRYASAVMVVVEIGAVFLFFPDKTLAQGELNFVYAAIFLYFVIVGGGRYSLRPTETARNSDHVE